MVELSKGQKVDLTKGNAALKILNTGLFWTGYCDLDTSVYALGQDGLVIPGGHVYFSHKRAFSDSIFLDKDDTTGGDANPDIPKENCRIILADIPPEVDSIAYCAWVWSGARNFGEAGNAYMELRDMSSHPGVQPLTNEYRHAVKASPVLMKYDIGMDNAKDKASIIGRLYRRNGDWKFEALGTGFRTKEDMDNYFSGRASRSSSAPTGGGGVGAFLRGLFR